MALPAFSVRIGLAGTKKDNFACSAISLAEEVKVA